MDKEPWALRLSEGITHKNPVRLNPDKAMAPVLNKLTGKNLLSIGRIFEYYYISINYLGNLGAWLSLPLILGLIVLGEIYLNRRVSEHNLSVTRKE